MRLRLALLYGGVFVLGCSLLLGIAYLLARQRGDGQVYSVTSNGKQVAVKGPHGPVKFSALRVQSVGAARLGEVGGGSREAQIVSTPAGDPRRRADNGFAASALPLISPLTRKEAERQVTQLRALATQQRNDELNNLLVDLGIALAIVALLSMGLGWFIAGRALRPLQTITKAARAISATNLHERLSLSGPRDELRELGDTFDELLERLERSFAAQRQFVANASHELRTPLTLERAIVEVALADPAASAQELRATCERVLAIGDQQERMIEALLTLARGERGLDQRVIFDLKGPVEEVVGSRRAALTRESVMLETRLESALTAGDRRLVERLVANLFDNAIRHNVPNGWIRLTTRLDAGRAVLAIENSGPRIDPERVERLFEPFTRLADRSARDDGHGLGLSIVVAIARAHDARVGARARPQGGLAIEVRFPVVSTQNSAVDGELPRVNGRQDTPAGDARKAILTGGESA